MIKLFQATDKTYSTNGDLVLNPSLAKVHKEDNGDFYLDIETPLIENEKSQPSQEGQTQTGTSFTIQDNDNTKLNELTELDGDTTQSGTPTPTSPQHINVVSGRQNIEVCGKNLFNISTITENTYINEYGNTGTSSVTNLSDYIVVNANTNYKLSYDYTTLLNSSQRNICYYDNNKSFVSSIVYFPTDKSHTITIPNNIRYLRFSYDKNCTDIQLEKGNQATTYEEYKGQSYEINLGKNLFNPTDTFTRDGITATINNQEITFNGTSTGGATYKMADIDMPSGTYTISMNVVSGTHNNAKNIWFDFFNGSTKVGYANLKTTGSVLKTFNSQISEVRVGFDPSDTFDNFTFKVQIEKGAIATTYTPYKTPIELCKIGDYQDRIYKENGTWYLEKNIGKFTLDGTESWTRQTMTVSTSYTYFYTTKYDNLLTWNLYGAYCNYLEKYDGSGGENPYITRGISINKSVFSTCASSSTDTAKMRVAIDNTIASTPTNFKNWLSTNKPVIYHQLATPVITEITDEELINQLESLRLLNGLNNISITSGDLPGEITIHYNYTTGYNTSIKYIDYLVPNNIIVANTPQGEQAFRISNIEKTRRKIKIKAYHVFYDSENLLIEDSYVVDKSCNDALDHLNNATSDISPFTTISNINTIASFRCVRKSLYEAIQVVLERWGGHLIRNNWSIGIYDTIGQDNGVTIRYAKNLKEMTATYDWDEVVTKLMPVGKDGILLNAIDPDASVYVESATKYAIPYTKTISFQQDSIVEDDYKDGEGELDEDAYKQALVDDLYAQATEYINNNYLPKVNYSLSANVEKVSDVGDTIEVIDEKLGINIMTNIISYDYDCILDRYTNLQFGNFVPTLKSLMTTINENTSQIVEEQNNTLAITLGRELDEATSQIWNALGNSYVIYDGDKILVVDTLPKEDATNVIMINNGGIGFSNTGITGTFSSAWTIDNVLNMENINVINLTADLIKGGILKLGSNLNQNGQIEVYDEANNLIAELNKNGLKMHGVDGSYVLMNNQVGFAGYDRNDNPIYWVSKDEFHMKKSVVEEEITLVNKMRIIPITIRNGNTIVNDGIGFINVPN